ncbi:hypothetical protein ACHWQZ_G004529 [Mnemiopsis leidyi]
MRLTEAVLLLWLPGCMFCLECPVGEIVRNTVLDRDEGRTVKSDCTVFWPTANPNFCKKFNYRVANYAKVYYACGHCNATGTGPGDKEYGAYSFTHQLKDITAGLEKHDPKQEVEEGECVTCDENNCFEAIAGRDQNSGVTLSLSATLASFLTLYLLCVS